jgi:hypothetical protein
MDRLQNQVGSRSYAPIPQDPHFQDPTEDTSPTKRLRWRKSSPNKDQLPGQTMNKNLRNLGCGKYSTMYFVGLVYLSILSDMNH